MTPLVLALALVTQSTDIEREAAAGVLRQIDSIEARLKPTESAQRLVTRNDPARDRVLARVASVWSGEMQGLSDWIGRHPEVGWHEFQAFDTLTALLRSYGFRVDTGVAGMPTAFVARWESPAGARGPTLGLIAEYDALRGTQGDFHGDQHNAQSPVAFAAARAVMEYMTQARVSGRIVIYGTPAEEVDPPAKGIMWRAGVFKGADILVRSHSTVETRRDRPGFGVCCLNIDAVKYTFTGRPAHQLTAWNGRNALEAAVQFYSAVDHLRSTWRSDHRVQGVIPEGGIAPNVVPDDTFADIGHKGFLLDAQIEAAVLFDFLTRPELRAAVSEEHQTLAGLQGQYLAALRRVYAPEIGADTALSKQSRAEIRVPQVARP